MKSKIKSCFKLNNLPHNLLTKLYDIAENFGYASVDEYILDNPKITKNGGAYCILLDDNEDKNVAWYDAMEGDILISKYTYEVTH